MPAGVFTRSAEMDPYAGFAGAARLRRWTPRRAWEEDSRHLREKMQLIQRGTISLQSDEPGWRRKAGGRCGRGWRRTNICWKSMPVTNRSYAVWLAWQAMRDFHGAS